MSHDEEEKLIQFQQKIDYYFKDKNLLKQALTTPLFGNSNHVSHYENLEFLGDPVLKLTLSLKLFKGNASNPGQLTKQKQLIENDNTLNEIGKLYFNLDKFILKTPDQDLDKTNIIADVLEAVSAALYLDSNLDIQMVEKKIVNVFYSDLPLLLNDSPIFNKNLMLEYLQKRLRITPKIVYEYEKNGPDNDLMWCAKNPMILDENDKVIYQFNKLKSSNFKSKKKAEFDLSSKILRELKEIL